MKIRPDDRPPPPYPKAERQRFADDPARAVGEFASSRKGWFERAIDEGFDAIAISGAYSDAVDTIVRSLHEMCCLRHQGSGGLRGAVLALGGYGRREMGLATDIDLLFLMEGEDEESAKAITDGILYPFWDSGMQVGGATRTLDDCSSIMRHDGRALTAMLDARLIAGDPALLEGLRGRLAAHFANRSARLSFVDGKIREHRERLRRYGGSIYLLQPNVKEGEGGLREIHTLRWIAMAGSGSSELDLMSSAVPEESSRKALRDAHSFLWAARHALHLCDITSNDRLTAQIQREVALRLGYSPDGTVPPDEAFMSDYYMRAEEMHLICDRGMELVRRILRPPSRARRILARRPVPGGIVRTEHGTLSFRKREGAIDALTELNLFATSRRTGLPVDPIAKGMLGTASSCELADIGSFEAAGSIREIFSNFKNLERTLTDMHECGALLRWFPEMAPMFHRIQHDGFHFYTAGVHSIRAIGEIANLGVRESKRIFPAAKFALNRVHRQHVLALATLFHDVGKGRGEDHSEVGAGLAAEIARRIGLVERDVSDVEFLVRSHLLMSTLAFRRDIKDPELIERFAAVVATPEILAMLYLLTFADIRAIGPNIWSDWKGSLLGELYTKTHEFMTAGGMSPSRRAKEEERVVSQVMRRLGSDVEREYVRGFLDRLPKRYIHSVSAEAIAAHILLARDVDVRPMSTFVRELPERGCTELSVVTRDSPGLFAKIAGVLAANSANVLDAQIYTSADGIAIDLLSVTDSTHGVLDDSDAWERIRHDLVEVLPQDPDISRVVGGRFKRRLLEMSAHRRPAEISVENDVSAQHTVVEVKADDRSGLLYTIASTFHELRCSIDLARITTHVDRVIDVFYIRDAGGRKIAQKERLEAIRERLAQALE